MGDWVIAWGAVGWALAVLGWARAAYYRARAQKARRVG